VVGDLDAPGQRPQVVPPIAVSFEADALTGDARKLAGHCRADGALAGAVEHGLGALGIELRLVTARSLDGSEVLDPEPSIAHGSGSTPRLLAPAAVQSRAPLFSWRRGFRRRFAG